MEKGLVSIIIPCYNGERFLHRCLDSILNQTYTKIEVIIVNDGSRDKSEEIILQYQEKFQEKNMKYVYVKQENKGLGGAINTGLKYFSGEFLCWPDVDDFLDPNSVLIRVNFLNKHPLYACVTSNAYMYNEEDLKHPIECLVSSRDFGQYRKNQFKRMIEGKSVFCPGCHMVRTSTFLEVNPNREIYEARRGQNWQMLLPVYYKHKRKFLNQPLYNYVIYQSSMSRGDNTEEKRVQRLEEYKVILKETINNMHQMPEKEKKQYCQYSIMIMDRRILDAAYQYNDKELYNKTYLELRKKGFFSIKYFYRKMRINNGKNIR